MLSVHEQSRAMFRYLRGVLAVAFVLAGVGSHATVASAGSETFMQSQVLAAGYGFASTSAHSGVTLIAVSTDHTVCPAVSQGFAGYHILPAPGINLAYKNCGYYQVSWAPNGTAGIYFHGTAYNPNVITNDVIGYATYYW